ncbi:MAG: sulfite exporter TauE/SafE family protein [Cyclobacteriaceae bacterium]
MVDSFGYSEVALLIGVGVIAGFLNVIAGGGSLLTLPVLIFMGLPPVIANASNRIAILFQNIFAVGQFKKAGVFEGKYSLYLGLSAIPGAVLGALLAVDIDENLFTKVLSVIMLIVGFLIIRKPNVNATHATDSQKKRTFL